MRSIFRNPEVLRRISELGPDSREEAAQLYEEMVRLKWNVRAPLLFVDACCLLISAVVFLLPAHLVFPLWLLLLLVGDRVFKCVFIPRMRSSILVMREKLAGDDTLRTYILGRLMHWDPSINRLVARLGLRE